MEKIKGDALIGFSDYFSNEDVGAGPKKGAHPKKGPAPGKTGVKIRPYPKAARKQTMEHHGKVITKAHSIATNAAKAIGRAQLLLARKPPIAKLPAGKVITSKTVHVGAAVAAKMTPKAKAAVAKHNDAVVKVAQATKALAQHALKTRASVTNLAKKMVVQKKIAKLLRLPANRRPKPKHHVGEIMNDPIVGEAAAEMFQEHYDAIGANPDPANPGYLDDGSPDPAFAATDPAGGLDMGDLGPLTDDPLDSGMTLPPAPGMDQFIADMTIVGGIAYDGSKGTPDGYVGSYGLMTRKTDVHVDAGGPGNDSNNHYGYVYGKYEQDDPKAKGIPWGAEMESNQWNHIHGRHHSAGGAAGAILSSGFSAANANWDGIDRNVPAEEAFASYGKSGDGGMYGPLVGNPAMPEFAAMRVDGAGNMFWLPQEAPDWLTFPIKQAAAITAQAAAKAAADAAAADAAAQTKARADEVAAQAAQDAANALAESQSSSQGRVDQTTQATAQAQAETQAANALVAQAQADTQQQVADSGYENQASEMVIAQARREQEYYAQHPEVEFAPPGGSPEETMPDGEPLPGADVMQDSDGEGYVDDGGGEDQGADADQGPSDDDILSGDEG